jgi:hypothetical protein
MGKSDKKVSRDGYIWGHIATIIFHIIIASLLITLYFKKKWSRETIEIWCVTLGSILLVVSILSIVPIVQYSGGLKEVVLVRK